ncbi:EAL domain-containing protein [Tropicimonas sp. IMCC6043]|uniref:EAL domain-containing protein n=1 Tax=Tropicimonas sp. IMCC6043 TaxID=2510645 RepID=UPI00101B7CAF|nr:EAL domain-containing protein [Tropicimonas sp. IMCC6043]RYH10650.1 EAL domain-containing protein [Tropicimonas sp. IMCC6043]
MRFPKSRTEKPDGPSTRPPPRMITVFFLLAGGLALIRLVQFGPSPLLLVQGIASLVPTVPAAFPAGPDRAAWLPVTLAALVVLAATGMIGFGLAAPSIFGLVAAVILAAAYVDVRLARAIMAVESLLVLGIGGLFAAGWLQAVTDLDALNAGFGNWVLLALVLVTVQAVSLHLIETFRRRWQIASVDLLGRQSRLESLMRDAAEDIAIRDVASGISTELTPTAQRLPDDEAAEFVGHRGGLDVSAELRPDARRSRDIAPELFEARSRGGGSAIRYSGEVGLHARDRGRLVHDLQGGVARGEFRLLYQPVVELTSGSVSTAEALIRWQHPELGEIGPDRFVPLAEAAGRIDALGDWALRQCCTDLPQMKRRFGAGFQASVNVSPLQLGESVLNRVETWRALISEAASAEGGLILEITESALLDPGPATVARLNEFRAAGAKIALDDFGAGHTSLLYYLTHDFDYLKIDRDFVCNLPESARALALCESILDFAQRLDAVAIAEGIESMAQAETLRHAGCAFGQGYLFAPPLPLERLLELPLTLPVPKWAPRSG